jgi:dihydrofolate synthase/folylpolyglutamate synthase
VEVGMGGRLDSTNILSPELCLITNIGYDHTQFLGDTLPLIAGEKAGIIKQGVPVVISQSQPDTREVFREKAGQLQAPLVFADEVWTVTKRHKEADNSNFARYEVRQEENCFSLDFSLQGNYQRHNLPGILEGISQLRKQGWDIPQAALLRGLAHVTVDTGLKGRWQVLQEQPKMIADTGHNESGMAEVISQLKTQVYAQLWMVIGMVNDKEIGKVLDLFPKEATYIFCQASIPRAMDADTLASKAAEKGLQGRVIARVAEAIEFVRKNAQPNDLIFIGGSTFVVAEIENL